MLIKPIYKHEGTLARLMGDAIVAALPIVAVLLLMLAARWSAVAGATIIRLAVSVVTCRQAERRLPASGLSAATRSASWRRTGISCQAQSIRRTPCSATREPRSCPVAVISAFDRQAASSMSGPTWVFSSSGSNPSSLLLAGGAISLTGRGVEMML